MVLMISLPLSPVKVGRLFFAKKPEREERFAFKLVASSSYDSINDF